jgi:hypothetical protein
MRFTVFGTSYGSRIRRLCVNSAENFGPMLMNPMESVISHLTEMSAEEL